MRLPITLRFITLLLALGALVSWLQPGYFPAWVGGACLFLACSLLISSLLINRRQNPEP